MQKSQLVQIGVAVCLAHMVPIGTLYLSLPILLPDIAKFFAFTDQEAAFAWAIIPLGSIFTVITGGVLADHFGERLTGGIAIFVSAAMAAMRALADEAWVLYVSLAGFGGASAVIYVCLPKLISRYFIGKNNGVMQGLSFSSFATGGIIATVLAVPIAEQFGSWRESTLVFAFASMIVGFVWFYLTPKPTEEASVAAPETLALQPLKDLLTRPDIQRMALAYAAFTGGYLGFSGMLPTQLEQFGWYSQRASNLLAVGQLSFLLGAIVVPWIADVLEQRWAVFLSSMIFSGVALILCWSLASQPDSRAIWLAAIGLGFTAGAVGIYFALITESIGLNKQQLGTALGIVTFASYLGGATFPIIASFVGELHAILPGLLFGFCGFIIAGTLVWTTKNIRIESRN